MRFVKGILNDRVPRGIVAFSAAGLVLIALLSGCRPVHGPASVESQHTTSSVDTPPTSVETTTSSEAPSTSASASEGTAPRSVTTPAVLPLLSIGDSGPAVLGLQRRLQSIGYWLGTPDGQFGDTTLQAVYALQKAAGLTPDGVVGPNTLSALARGARPTPRVAPGYVIEVDLHDDLLMIVRGDRLLDVLNTSTGGGYVYSENGVSSVANTPTGWFTITRQVDGVVTDALGQLWRPKFFDAGFAVHGDGAVPPYPVSHGCVRVSDGAINWIWADDVAPLGTRIWIY